MAVSKRTRFEVLRRDQHTCQYCGEKAPNVTLQIDHVMPVALGGTDQPGNLVTACRDCNSGKTSIAPDAPLVQSLSAEAAAYALGMLDKMTRFRADIEALGTYQEEFDDEWGNWTAQGNQVPLPHDYRMSLFKWMQMGIPASIFSLVIPAAMSRRTVLTDGKFTYMAGIINNMLNAREIDLSVTSQTAAVYTDAEMDEIRFDSFRHGRESGERTGMAYQIAIHAQRDYLQHHIDRTFMLTAEGFDGNQYLTGGVGRAA